MIGKLLALDKPGRRFHTARMPMPLNPIDAVTHPDPWPYYAQLREAAPFAWDASLKLWVAAREDVVDEALRHPALRVRPPAEPVPPALQGTAAGHVFGLLVRMNDGAFHETHRPAVLARVAGLTRESVARCAQEAARDLWPRRDPNAWITGVPVQAMAHAIGVAAGALDATCAWVADFTQGIAPGADTHRIEAAGRAAQALMEQGRAQGLDEPDAANRIALMQQSLDATAALLGEALASGERDLPALADRRPPVHNTRRFAAGPVVLAGRRVEAGQGVLLLLAAARRPFGGGAHRCPGDAVALQIAASALDALRGEPAFDHRAWRVSGYRPLPNARIPLFHP
jgi:cytochrome P450